jgi:DNA (cytosine-5)-methyltransferase 1
MISIELFGCSGGMAEGFRRAGITFAFAFDRDPDACASYTTNLGHAPIQIDVRDLLRMARGGWSPGPLDLVVADPPCTPWSRAGKRGGLDDARDLLQETAELIALLQPRAYLIANVPGLDDGPHLPVVQRVIGGLGKRGYCVGDFARLDAADYGVPQHRVRPFWFGHRGGPCLTWPTRTHGPADPKQLTCIEPLRPWITCRDALGHLPIGQLGRPVRLRWKAYDAARGGHRPSAADKPARAITRNANGDGALVTHPKHPINRPDAPSSTLSTKKRGAQGACALAWPWDRPATAITEDARILSTSNAILLSEQAKAILQGFPEGWHFAGKTKGSRHAQIGMAMPPPLAETVARCIARWLIQSAP